MSKLRNKARFFGKAALRPLSALYGSAVSFRNWAYDSLLLSSYSSKLPVICAGNVTAGGSGKSPFVQYLAAMLSEKGQKPVILSRGYGGKLSGPVLLDSASTPDQVGDEAVMHYQTFAGQIPLVISRNRKQGADYIADNCLGEVIILDDGFQHRALRRDLNFLLLDVSTPQAAAKWQDGKLLPQGLLRESLAQALARASCLIFVNKQNSSNCTNASYAPASSDLNAFPRFNFILRASHFSDAFSGEVFPLDRFSASKGAALSGIAAPESFFSMLKEIKLDLEELYPFADHHPFCAEELHRASDGGKRAVFVSAKDAVKLKPFITSAGQVYILHLKGGLSSMAEENALWEMLQTSALARPARISFLSSDLGGGTGNHLLQMSKYWDSKLWQAQLIADAKLTAREMPALPVVYLAALPFKILECYPFSQIYRFWQIIRLLAKFRPDLVHAYFFWPIIYGRLLRLSGRINLLIENREDQGFNWGKHEYLLLRLSAKIPDKVICVSEAVRRTVIEKERLSDNQTLVIHNGVAANIPAAQDHSLRKELGLAEGESLVGMVANFNREVKGVEYFIEAIPLILTQCPRTWFILLGRGAGEAQLRARAELLGINSRIIFAGFQKQIERYYSLMTISVLTSLSEGLSLTLLESMSFGLPVVASKVGGNPELVQDGITGFLVPPRDALSFAEKVVILLRDKQLCARMGEAAKERIRQYFRIEDTAAKYLNLYQQLLRK